MIALLNPNIQIAELADVPSLLHLLNNAYRGEASTRGWTTEAHLIAGNTRTDETSLQQVLQQPNSVILKYLNEQEQIIGCVNLQQHDNRIYLGMLSVSPLLQGGGIGKKLLLAAEEYTVQKNCNSIYMTVISVRDELINWYKRNGFVDTGERKPFIEDNVTGKHLQTLEFMVMEKIIGFKL